jgi:hypothetical protein
VVVQSAAAAVLCMYSQASKGIDSAQCILTNRSPLLLVGTKRTYKRSTHHVFLMLSGSSACGVLA